MNVSYAGARYPIFTPQGKRIKMYCVEIDEQECIYCYSEHHAQVIAKLIAKLLEEE